MKLALAIWTFYTLFLGYVGGVTVGSHDKESKQQIVYITEANSIKLDAPASAAEGD